MLKPDNKQPSHQEPALLATMHATIDRYRMVSPGDHVVVAVSGGADSVALLHALCELTQQLKLRLTVAHLNHGLRGDTAQREAAFVEKLARSLNLPCICELRDVLKDKSITGTCLQEAARTVRYHFLNEVLERCGAQKIALGHTMDDQAETVLIRLLRGASTLGLGGIPPVRHGTLIRPLINVRRKSIEFFLQERDISFVPDTSADEPHYLRNSIRHELLPLLTRQYNPRVVEALCTTANLARDDEVLLQDTTAHAADAVMKRENDSVRIPINLFADHPLLGGRIVRRALELLRGSCRSLTYTQTNAVLSLVNCRGSNKMITLPRGLVVRREYNELVMCSQHTSTAFHVQVDHLPADIQLTHINARVQIRKVPFTEDIVLLQPAISDTIYLAVESLRLPVAIRSWNPGDRIHPFGFKTEKKIKSIFADEKIPVRLRGTIPLIESEGRIVTVGTLRMAECCRVIPPCGEVIAVTVTSDDET